SQTPMQSASDARWGSKNQSKRAHVCSFGCFSRSTDDPNAECIHGLPARFYPAPMALPLESVPNFSEGRDAEVIAALERALSRPGRLLDIHTDWDHHRSVFTIVGSGDELVETLLAGSATAAERIDLHEHEGEHPRIGAADVVPLVPLRSEDEP